MSSECDDVSWSTWIYVSSKSPLLGKVLILYKKLSNIFQSEAKLTTANRKTMNELVDAANTQIVRSDFSSSLVWSTY